MKLKIPMLSVVISALLFIIGTSLVNAQGNWALNAANYEWLLDSPMRPYLSSAAQNFLALKFAHKAHFPGIRDEEKKSAQAMNLIVNDRLQDENPSLTTQSESAIAVQGRRVIIAWNDTGQFQETGSFVGFAFSEDGGNTFVDAGVVPPVRGGFNLGDPDVAFDRAGNFYISMIALDGLGMSYIGVSKSTDGGFSFAPPVNVSTIVNSFDSFQDKEFIAVDATGGQYDGYIYASWSRFSGEGSQIMFSRSIDGGATFQDPIALNSPGSIVSGSMPKVGPNGEVYVVWERINTPGIHISKSLDGGRTFGTDGIAEVLVSKLEFIGQPGSPNTCGGRQVLNGFVDAGIEHPTMAINPNNDEVYVVFNSNPPGIDESDVYISRSTNSGRGWSVPLRINDDSSPNDQFMPAMAVAPDGTLGVIWYDRRNDVNNLDFDLYMSVSKDGGRTWLPNKKINTITSKVPPLGPNFDSLRPCYMGDYNDIAADEQGFYIAWGDNRELGLTWKTLEEMPTPREATANAAIGTGIFIVGGTKLGFGEIGDSRLIEMYETRSGAWKSLALMPTPRSYAAALSAGMSLYVAGGQSSRYGGVTDRFERFDAITNTWESLPPMKIARMALGAARVGNRLYFMGGQSCISPICGETLSAVEIYDLSTKSWSLGSPLPGPRAGFGTTVIGKKIYISGGYATRGVHTTTVGGDKAVLEYDPETDVWRVVAAMTRTRMFPLMGACGDNLIISGGLDPQTFSLIERDAWSFNVKTGEWKRVAAPKFDRSGIAGVTVGTKLYAIGGSSAAQVPQPGANEAFDCINMGFERPDPDIYFAFEPLLGTPVASASHEDTKSPKFEVKALRNGRAVSFGVKGTVDVESLRVQVFSLDGNVIFDSGERQELLFQWNLNTNSGRLAANGVYLYLITIRDKTGKIVRSEVRKILVLR